MKRSVFETILGGLVLVIAALFLSMAYQKSENNRAGAGYELLATFSSVAGLHEGADVRIAGVKVGDVSKLELDGKTYQAVAHLTLDDGTQVPDDSVAEITSEGLLGGNYVSVEVGASEKNLAPGSKFQYTQAGANLTQLLGQVIFSKGSGNNNAAPAATPAAAPADAAPAAPVAQ